MINSLLLRGHAPGHFTPTVMANYCLVNCVLNINRLALDGFQVTQ